MRVLHFLHRAPPEYSGAALQAMTLLEALRRLPDAPQLEALAFAEDPTRTCFPEWLDGRVLGLGRPPLGRLAHRRALRRVIATSPAELLHVHGYYRPAVAAGLASGKRVVLKTTMLGVDDGTTLAARSRTDRALVSRVDRLVSLTPALSEANAGLAPEVCIPNGVDLTRWNPAASVDAARAERERLGIAEDALIFLYTGGGYERKGVRELPALWRGLVERLGAARPHLVACGEFLEPDTARWLEAELAGHGRVTVLPEVVPDPVPLVAAADVFLFLSTREGLPNAVLEAVALDTFVFARELPGTYDGLLTAENSLRVDALDTAAVEALAARLAAGGTRSVDNTVQRERFSIEAVAARYAALYREVLAP